MSRKLKRTDALRLPDGRVMTLAQAVAQGAVVLRRAWRLWQNETHGNCLNMRPAWRLVKNTLYTSEPGPELRRTYGAGFEFREVWMADRPDGSGDWGEVAKSEAIALGAGMGERPLEVEKRYYGAHIPTLRSLLQAGEFE